MGLFSKIIIDGDVLLYRAGFAADSEGKGAAGACLIAYQIIKAVQNTLQTNEIVIYLTDADKDKNYRYEVAKTVEYKVNRKDKPKPVHFNSIRNYLLKRGAVVVSGKEADDQMATDLYKDQHAVLAGIDKDLLQVPGWHYNLNNKTLLRAEDFGCLWLEERSNKKYLKGFGIVMFFAQCLTGDAADSIPGLSRVGAVAAYKALEGVTTVLDAIDVVVEKYLAKGHNLDYLLEQATLLWMQRKHNERLPDWMEHRIQTLMAVGVDSNNIGEVAVGQMKYEPK